MDPTKPDDASELARLRLWVDAAQDFGRLSLWERDTRDGSGRWDRHIFTLYGLPPAPQAPHYDEMLELLHPDDRIGLRASYLASLERPGRHETRFRIVHRDGHVVHVHSIWQVPATGHQVVGVLIDDTESLSLARAHEVARTQLGMASQLAGISFWRTDLASGRVHRVGDEWHGSWADPGPDGRPLAALREHVHPDDRDALERASQRALASDEAPIVEARSRAADGEYRTFLTRRVAQRDGSGRPTALLGVAMDITAQMRDREHLSELLERQDMIVDATGTGVWRWDPDAGVRHWNDALRAIYGLPLDGPLPALDGDGVAAPVLPPDRPAVADALRRVRGPDAPCVEASYRIRRPDGEVRMLVGRARRMPGSTQAISGIVLDVTDMRRAEAALRDKAVAEAASRAKDAFLSRVSHELRTPLNAVLGFTGLVLDERAGPLTDGQRGHLQQVQDAGRHLLDLVDDLLHIGRHDSLGGADDASKGCDLAAVVEQAVAWQAERASAAGVRVCVSGHGPRVRGDEQAWRQVIGNLLSNAIKYNRPGGWVEIALRPADDPGWAELALRDSGIGMSPAQLRHLFEPFNRLGAERLGVPGTGLGMSIVRRIVRSLGGDVGVESQPGAGTSVRLRVPRAPDDGPGADRAAPAGGERSEPSSAAPSAAPPVAPAVAPSGPPSAVPAAGPGPVAAAADVVYVEDNKVNALLVEQVLARRPQLRLHVAGGVEAGHALTRRVRPALLLVDMHLPDGTGYDLIERLRRDGALPAHRCIALSADVMPAEVERALSAGFDDYWAKPIDVARFLADIDRLLAPSG
jgi:PAS domain S-box-containing protein